MKASTKHPDDSRPAVAVIAHGTDATYAVKSELHHLGGVWRGEVKLWKFSRTGVGQCLTLIEALAELGVDYKVGLKRVKIKACPDCGTFPVPQVLHSGSRVLVECVPKCVITVTGGNAEHAVEVWNRRVTDGG